MWVLAAVPLRRSPMQCAGVAMILQYHFCIVRDAGLRRVCTAREQRDKDEMTV